MRYHYVLTIFCDFIRMNDAFLLSSELPEIPGMFIEYGLNIKYDY